MPPPPLIWFIRGIYLPLMPPGSTRLFSPWIFHKDKLNANTETVHYIETVYRLGHWVQPIPCIFFNYDHYYKVAFCRGFILYIRVKERWQKKFFFKISSGLFVPFFRSFGKADLFGLKDMTFDHDFC